MKADLAGAEDPWKSREMFPWELLDDRSTAAGADVKADTEDEEEDEIWRAPSCLRSASSVLPRRESKERIVSSLPA